MMKLGGRVFIDGNQVGTFTVDSDNEIVVDLNGGRWTAPWIFQWALDREKSVLFQPQIEADV